MNENGLKRKKCNIDNDKIKIAYILGCFPDTTPTFVYNEIVGLSCLGVDIIIFSIHKSVGNNTLFENNRFLSKTINAGPLYSHPIILSHIIYLFMRPSVYLKLLFNYKNYGGKKAFWNGVYFSRRIRQLGIKHVHAHFSWNSTDVARIISSLADIPFSFTAHANDIYVAANHLKEKLGEAKFIVTCVKNNKNYLTMKFGQILAEKIKVVYHGIDLGMFKPTEMKEKEIDILSIGNFVEKKGFHYLIEACEILKKRGILLKCLVIDTGLIGERQVKTRLVNMIKELGLEKYVELTEKRPQYELPKIYAKSRVFVLPSFITDVGDRDGIPNVVGEAMAMGMPVIASNIPNISELIEHGKDGSLVREKDPQALADAIEKLLSDEKLSKELGRNARRKIEDKFDSHNCLARLEKIFKLYVNESKN